LSKPYGDIATKVEVPGRDEPKADILRLVYNWLCDERNGRWLIILDNVDDGDIFFTAGTSQKINITSHTRPLESFLPRTPNGAILITSRNRIAAMNLVGTHGSIIQVEPKGEEDALALLNTRVSVSESSKADAKALVQALGSIPLAISHAAAYIKTRASRITISRYLEFFRESEEIQVRRPGRVARPSARPQHTICGSRNVADLVQPDSEDGAVSCRLACVDVHVRSTGDSDVPAAKRH